MEIHLAPETEAAFQHLALKQGKAVSQVVEETVARAWEIVHEQDEWLQAHDRDIDAQIQTGLAELARGDYVADHQLDEYLGRLKAQPR